jgi:hypothetical protein
MEGLAKDVKKKVSNYGMRAAAYLLGRGLKAWMDTMDSRFSGYDFSADVSSSTYTEPVLYVHWHEYILLPTAVRRGSGMTLLVSEHRDANWLGWVAEDFGFRTVRGSSTKGGIKAILRFRKEYRDSSLVVVPDGPKGPRRVVSQGCIQLSSMLRMPIVPVGMGFHRPYRAKSWDRLAIPRLSSRVRLVLGPKITIPRGLDDQGIESYRSCIEQMLHVLTADAESWAEDGSTRVDERGLFPAPPASLD